MDEIQGVVSFVAKGFIWFSVIAATLALLVISAHVLYYFCMFCVMDIGIDQLMIEGIVLLFSLGVLYVFVPSLRR